MKVIEVHLAFWSETEGFHHFKPSMLLTEQMLLSLENILNDENHKIQFVAITTNDYHGETFL